ncbi:MAG TPA: serine hydrolase domain-containing protein [Gemmatimonadales bacterium]|nr:serine hydrolase domain-containing protein [Gemmatimonadales bacterium]
MTRRTAICGFVLCIGLTLTSPDLSWADARGITSSSATAAVARVLAGAVERGDTPGVVGVVVDRDGVLFEGASGRLDIARDVALRTDAIFRIASMTKPVTSVAIMMLLEQGKLELDDPVSKYLPGFDKLQVITKFNADGTYETRPAKRTMTLRHLLTHTSGIGYGFSSPIVARLQEGNEKDEWQLPLLHEPGERWTYSASTRVLGLIVEKITGESLEAYFQKRIFVPLRMIDTSFAVPIAKQSRVITVYSHADGKFQQQPGGTVPSTPTPPFGGDYGLYSTARDYGQFIRMLLNRGRLGDAKILSARSVGVMSRNQIGAVFVSQQPAADPGLTRPFPLGAGRDKFGLGFQVTAPSDVGSEYRSAGSLSWAGLYNTEFWVDPKRGVGGVLMMQYLPFYDEAAIRTLRDFEAAVYEQLAPPR